MARIGNADREHSGHYTSAVAVVAVAVAGLAWFGQNRTLAAAAAALGLYALHLFSIRFLLDNQKRQQRVLDAQWEVLQRFIDTSEGHSTEGEDLVPAMPVDREAPERPSTIAAAPKPVPAPVPEPGEADAPDVATPVKAPAAVPPEVARPARPPAQPATPVVRGEVVPPAEALGGAPGKRPADDAATIERLTPPGHTQQPARASVTEVPVPRHFALGTVALVRDLLTPAEVARVLLEQRRQSGKKFGVLAVEMGLLSESQREELLLAQQEGLFTDAEMRDARQRLREFRETAAHSMAGLD